MTVITSGNQPPPDLKKKEMEVLASVARKSKLITIKAGTEVRVEMTVFSPSRGIQPLVHTRKTVKQQLLSDIIHSILTDRHLWFKAAVNGILEGDVIAKLVWPSIDAMKEDFLESRILRIEASEVSYQPLLNT